jgi:hypothetical protein
MINESGRNVIERERFHYPPGSKYGDRESWRASAGTTTAGPVPFAEVDDAIATGPAAQSDSHDEAEANAITGDDFDKDDLASLPDLLSRLTRDGQLSVVQKDGATTVELMIAGRRISFDSDDIRRLLDQASGTGLEGAPSFGAEEVIPTELGPVPLHVRAIATGGDDPATISHPKDANNQTDTTGLLAFTGFNFTAQLLADLTAAVIVNVDTGDSA